MIAVKQKWLTTDTDITSITPTLMFYSFWTLYRIYHFQLMHSEWNIISEGTWNLQIMLCFSAHGVPLAYVESGDPYKTYMEGYGSYHGWAWKYRNFKSMYTSHPYPVCSDPTSDGQVSVLQCHPWIGNADTHSTRRIYNRVAITHYYIECLQRELITIIWLKAI